MFESRKGKKRKQKREQNKKLYDEHQGALELLDKHSESLKMLGNNLELMKFAAILLDESNPNIVESVHLPVSDDINTISMRVCGVSIVFDLDSFHSANQEALKRLEESRANNS